MNFHPTSPSLLLPLLFIFLASCADKPAAAPAPTPKSESKLVGRIASIHQKGNFTLIQSYGPWKIESGAILATLGAEGRSANLRVTGEKTGQFAAADIQSGTLEVGDAVYTTLSMSQKESFEVPKSPVEPASTSPQP
jgi:hypothetical protein